MIHFRQYLAGKQFTLVTDSSAVTWLFRSRDVSPKLRRLALKLVNYDILLHWKNGTHHYMPDALSSLPRTDKPHTEVDDLFPDGLSPNNPLAYAGSRGPVLDEVSLDHRTSADTHGQHGECPLSALLAETADRSAKGFSCTTGTRVLLEISKLTYFASRSMQHLILRPTPANQIVRARRMFIWDQSARVQCLTSLPTTRTCALSSPSCR